jgi:hypothetical protein
VRMEKYLLEEVNTLNRSQLPRVDYFLQLHTENTFDLTKKKERKKNAEYVS